MNDIKRIVSTAMLNPLRVAEPIRGSMDELTVVCPCFACDTALEDTPQAFRPHRETGPPHGHRVFDPARQPTLGALLEHRTNFWEASLAISRYAAQRHRFMLHHMLRI